MQVEVSTSGEEQSPTVADKNKALLHDVAELTREKPEFSGLLERLKAGAMDNEEQEELRTFVEQYKALQPLLAQAEQELQRPDPVTQLRDLVGTMTEGLSATLASQRETMETEAAEMEQQREKIEHQTREFIETMDQFQEAFRRLFEHLQSMVEKNAEGHLNQEQK